VPWFFVGDAAFALAPWMQKPYPHRGQTRPERLYNYRLSWARRIVENGFGILVGRWRCLTTTLGQEPDNVVKITSACVTLHNLVRVRRGRPQPAEVDQGDERNGAWRQQRQLEENDNMAGARPGNSRARRYREALDCRNYLRDYYISPQGAVHWQDRIFEVRARAQADPVHSDSDSEVD
jgi:hypothetical protein